MISSNIRWRKSDPFFRWQTFGSALMADLWSHKYYPVEISLALALSIVIESVKNCLHVTTA